MLVATDIAARGIHVDAVPLVVHFDPPADATDYVHRSGRTGRAGADGTVVSLIGTEHLASTRVIQRKLGLAGGVSSPDVPSLARPGAGRRSRSGPAPAKAAAGGDVGAGRPSGASVDRTVRASRPARRRGRGTGRR